MDVSSNEDDPDFNLGELKVEQGTDAPKFLILNVIPGRPDSQFRLKSKANAANEFESKHQTRIKDIVEDMKANNERKGLSKDHTAEMGQLIDRFALLKGVSGGNNDDVVAI